MVREEGPREKTTRSDSQINRETQPERSQEYRQQNRIARIVRARDVSRRQSRGVTPVLNRSENHASRSDKYQNDADHVRQTGVQGMPCFDGTGRCREHAQEQPKSRDDEAEGHDGEAGTHPGEEGALSSEEDSGVT